MSPASPVDPFQFSKLNVLGSRRSSDDLVKCSTHELHLENERLERGSVLRDSEELRASAP
jgi:hypothetical protein